MHWNKVAVAATENTGQSRELHVGDVRESWNQHIPVTLAPSPKACREVQHALVSQTRAQTTGKAWEKRGIVPAAAAGPEPRLNPLEKEQHGIAQPGLQSLGMLSSGLRQIRAWSANHNSSSHGTGPAHLEQV